MNVEDLLEDTTPRLPAGMHDNLLRAQESIELIALITHQVARLGRIHAGHVSALASYVSEDLDSLLTGIESVPEV